MVCPNWGGKRSSLMILTGSTKSLQALNQWTGSTKSLQALNQWTGRVFRAEFPIIIYLDDDNRISKNHWRDMKKWFLSSDRNGTIIDKYMTKENNTDHEKIHNNMVNRVRLKMLSK